MNSTFKYLDWGLQICKQKIYSIAQDFLIIDSQAREIHS